MSYNPPLKNTAFTFYTSLISQSAGTTFQVDPTLEAGDVKVSIDGGTFTNLTTLPTVVPSGSKNIEVTLTSDEMNGDNIVVVFSDVADNEWSDQSVSIQTTLHQFDDIYSEIIDLPDNLAADAEFLAAIKYQIVEALNTDTYAEIGQENPSATQTIRKMIAYLYKSWRNKKDQSATTFELYADNGTTIDQKATITDSGTLTTIGEIGTGP